MKNAKLTNEVKTAIKELATNAFKRALAENRSIAIAQDQATIDFLKVNIPQ